ncbi:MAG TPA: 2-C-methyl-D-erythritol 2,4-cyclodiphosphate synthase [Clostridia bacterium]
MKLGIGQDSHRFERSGLRKSQLLGGVVFEECPSLEGNSDADVVLHAITNAISGITCHNILGKVSDDMCLKHGITDSSVYLKEALKYLGENKITHVSLSMECSIPKISPRIPEMRGKISELIGIPANCVGITATSGEGLTGFGKGEGIQVFCCVTAI